METITLVGGQYCGEDVMCEGIRNGEFIAIACANIAKGKGNPQLKDYHALYRKKKDYAEYLGVFHNDNYYEEEEQ